MPLGRGPLVEPIDRSGANHLRVEYNPLNPAAKAQLDRRTVNDWWISGPADSLLHRFSQGSGVRYRYQESRIQESGTRVQSNRLETDSSVAVRPIASPISVAIDMTLMLEAVFTSSVGWIESVMTSSLSREPEMRAMAPPDSTPCVM